MPQSNTQSGEVRTNTLKRSRAERRRRAAMLGAAAAFASIATQSAKAASGTWVATPTDANWATGTNWSSNPTAPGATSGTTNTDTATFSQTVANGNGTTSPVVIDSGRIIQNITFTSSAASAYVIGTTGGNSLQLSSGGTLQTANSVANIETVNAPLVIEPASSTTAGAYTFSSNAPLAANILQIGGPITLGATTAIDTLNLAGSNTGANILTGTVSDTGAGGLILNNTGNWTFGGNSTSTLAKGAITVNGGTFTFGNAGNAPTLNMNASSNSNVGVFVIAGNFTLNAGTLSATTVQGLVLNGNNTYTQTGGAFSTNGLIEFANGGGVSTVNVSGGSLTTSNLTADGIDLAVRGTTTVNLSGTGSVTAPTLNMSTSQLSGGAATSTFNLGSGTTGGTLTVGTVIKGTNGSTGTQTFNFNGGTLKASASSTTFMTGLTTANVRNGGAVVDTQAFNDTIGQALLHSSIGGDNATDGGLQKLSGGTLTLTGTETYTGDTTISAGTLTIGGAGSLGSGSYAGALNNAGTFIYNSSGAQTLSGVVSGGGSLTESGAGTLTLTNANTGFTGSTTITGGTLQIGGSGGLNNGSYAGTITFSGGTGVFNYNSSAAQSLNGNITGAGALTQSGAGTLTLSGAANSYSGATTVSGGILKAGSTGAFSATSPVTLANVAGVTLDITGFSNSIGSLTGGGSTGGTVTLGAAQLTIGGDNTSPASYAGTFSGTGTVVKNGTGTLTLGGNGTSSVGGINVNGGTLTFGSATESPVYTVTTSSTGLYIGQTGANTAAFNFNLVNGSITANVSQGLVLGTTNIYTQTGGSFSTTGLIEFANNGAASVSTVNISAGSLTSSNGSNDAIDLAVRGTTTVNLSGTGIVTTPILNMTTNQTSAVGTASTFNLGSGAGNGGTLVVKQILNGTNTSTAARTFNFNGGTLRASASSTTFMTGLTTANVRNGGAVIDTQTFSDTIGQALVHSGIGGDNAIDGGLTKLGSGTLSLTASNSYTGATTISAGTLRANNGSSGSATGSGNITVAASSPAANYGGGVLGGSGTVTGTVTLNSGAAKQGGIIAAGASTSTSTGIGTLTTGAETWNGGSAYQWKIGSSAGTSGAVYAGINGTPGTTYDTLVVSSGGLTVPASGGTAVTVAPSGALTGVAPGTYNWAIAQVGTLTEGSTAVTPSAVTPLDSSIFALDTSGLTVNGAAPSGNFSLYFEQVGGSTGPNDLVLSYNVAPEPGTALLVLAGAMPLLAGRRRRRSSGTSDHLLEVSRS